MNNILITSIEESCNNCIRSSNLFAIKIFLENGLINSTMLNNMMQHSIDMYANFQIIKLLIDYGATIPTNIQQIIKLPDELFMEAINDIQFKTDLELVQLCLEPKNYSKVKWNVLCSGFDFDQLNNQQIYSLMKYAYLFSNYFAFCYFTDFVKHNKQLLFLFLFNVSAGWTKSCECYNYLIDLLKLDQNQLVLCDICDKYHLQDILESLKGQVKFSSFGNFTKKIRLHQRIIELKYTIGQLRYDFNGSDEELIMVDKWLEIINEVINELANVLT
jgi:hypothetical protein